MEPVLQGPNPRLQFLVLLKDRVNEFLVASELRLQLCDPLAAKCVNVCFRSSSLHSVYLTPPNLKCFWFLLFLW